MRRRRPIMLVGDAVVVLLAILACTVHLPAAFIERSYANGVFADLNLLLVPVTNAVPFAIGDVLAGSVIAGILLGWILTLRRAAGRHVATATRLVAHTAGFVALLIIAFEVLWGWNYRRLPVAARVAYDPARVTPTAVSAFADYIALTLNDNVAAAHARAAVESPAAMRTQLARDFAPVIARLGDDWPVAVTVPKHTVADIFYEMAGVGGQYDPYTFETLLNASFSPYEIPRALAHEWSHVAGFGDEGDANLIGTITCLRSSDPLIRYSGAFWTYPELPESDRKRLRLAPAVIADMKESQARFLRYYQPHIFDVSWHLYDKYLQANGVAGGVTSYSRFIQLLVGTRFDAAGLPRAALASIPEANHGKT